MFKKNKLTLLIIAGTLMFAVSARAGDIPVIDCMIEPNVMVELSSPVAGVLDTLTVDKSDEVKKGQLVATLKSELELVSMKTSMERLKLSKVEHKRAVELYRDEVITLSDRDKSANEKKLFELELQQAKAKLNLRQVKSPIDGVVVKRYAMPGEFVETRPILQLAQLDPLRIEVVSPVSNYGKIVKGMRAKILPEFGEYKGLIAEVVVVDKVIDAASGTFGVRLELANKDYAIPGGLKCQVSFIEETVKAKTADNTDETLMCSSVGPYKNRKTLTKVLDELGSDIKQKDLRTVTEEKAMNGVFSKKFASASEVADSHKRISASGIKDIAIVKKEGGYYISFGLYNRQAPANNRLVALKKKGYDVMLKPTDISVNRYWADVTYLPQSVEMLNVIVPGKNRVACSNTIKLSLLKK